VSRIVLRLRHKYIYYSKNIYFKCVSNLLNSRHKYIYYSKNIYFKCVLNRFETETHIYLLLLRTYILNVSRIVLRLRHKYIYYSKKHYNICVSNVATFFALFFSKFYLVLLCSLTKMVKINPNAVPQLPVGWQCIKSLRTRGKTKGVVDKHYLSPSFQHFRSLSSVRRHLAQENSQPAAPAPPAPLHISVDEDGNEIITIYDSSDEESEWL